MTNVLSDAKLSDESVRNLHGLIGETVSTIYSPAIDVDKNRIFAETFSLQIGRNAWLALEVNEVELDEYGFGTWQLSTFLTNNPKHLQISVKRAVIGKDEVDVHIFDTAPSRIFLTASSIKIEKISIYEHIEPFGAAESILSAEAIIFQHQDSKRFCISWVCYGIHEMLCFTENETVIDSMLERYRLRQEFK